MTWLTYTEVKFIPDPIKNETVNVGVLVIDEAGNTKSKFIKNFDHLTKTYGIEDASLLEIILHGYEINKNKDPKYLEVLSKESIKDHRIKVPLPRAIDSESLDAALNTVYSQMISIPDSRLETTGRAHTCGNSHIKLPQTPSHMHTHKDTLEITPDLKARLEGHRNHPNEPLADTIGRILERYEDDLPLSEEELDGVKKGLADIDAGRTMSHEDVTKKLGLHEN